MAIITLTTDFGTQDGYVGAMKGRILSMCPSATIIDISHDIEPQNIRQAAWTLVRSSPYFPTKTIHVAVIDPGVGSDRRPLLLKSLNQWYVGPDNGIFTEIFRQFGSQEIYELHRSTEWWQSHSSFDGLALFAPAAACLASGVTLDKLGTAVSTINTIPPLEPVIEKNCLKGQIILFDRFGNAITNIHQDRLKTLGKKQLSVICNNQPLKLVDHYEACEPGGSAIINSDQLLEIAVFSRSAREILKLSVEDMVTVQ